MERERRSREYWEQELSEYWDSGLTVQEYSDQKELPYEITPSLDPSVAKDFEVHRFSYCIRNRITSAVY